MNPAILTLDLGTSACKAVLFGLSGEPLSAAQREYPTAHPGPGLAEQHPADWWAAAVAAVRQVREQAPDTDVIAVGLSSQRETVVPVDHRGRPLRPAITWLDRRSQPQAASLAASMGAETVHRRTGMRAEATFTATKLRWLAESEPDTVAQADLFLQPKDFLLLRLTGRAATDPTLASRTLLWSVNGGWLEEMAAWAGIQPHQLPPVVPSGEVAGHLTPEAAAELGLRPGVPVAAGAGDRCCEALGIGARSGGRAMVSIGTAANVAAVISRPDGPLDPGVLYTCHAVPGQWLAEQGISTGGSVLRWLRDTAGHTDYEQLSAAAAQSPPGAHGLILLPFLMGARATRWNPDARGALLGLTLAHSPGDLARAVMEGVACEVRACLDVLRRTGGRPVELAALGGGARSPLWAQIQADLTGLPVLVPRTSEAASVGAMLLAGQAVGLWPDPVAAAQQVNPAATRYEPAPERMGFYDRLYTLYNQLYAAVEPLYGALAELSPATI